MLRTQVQIVGLLDRLGAIGSGFPDSLNANLANLLSDAKSRELIVPVVGSFSAGKSTLINKFLGSDKLPTAITPETSLATELRYGMTEYIEAVCTDGTTVRFAVDELSVVKERASEFSFARLFLNNENLRRGSSLVLVDMPGFDSPLDTHNKAILAYLSRGSHYVVLSSVEEGTVTRSLLWRLQEIEKLGRKFSFFLSKADLRSKEALQELKNHYQQTLDDLLETKTSLQTLGTNPGEDLASVLQSIDAEGLFLSLFRDQVKELCYSFIESLNLQIAGIEQNVEQNKHLMEEMKASVSRLEKKSDELVRDLESRYSKVMVGDLVNSVGADLTSSIEQLTSIAASGNVNAVTERLTEIVRHSLLVAMGDRLGDLNQKIVADFSFELRGLEGALQKASPGTSPIQDLGHKIQLAFGRVSQDWSNIPIIQKVTGDLAGNKGLFKSITGALAIMTGVLSPVVEIVIFFLPEILTFLTGEDREKQQKDSIREKLLQEVIPGVKLKLRTELPPIMKAEITGMIQEVRDQYQEKIASQQASVEQGVAEKAMHGAELDTKLKDLNHARDQIKAIVTDLLALGA